MTEHEKIQEIIRQKEQAPVALDPRRTALIIVDVQRFFTRPDSEFAHVFPPGCSAYGLGRSCRATHNSPFTYF